MKVGQRTTAWHFSRYQHKQAYNQAVQEANQSDSGSQEDSHDGLFPSGPGRFLVIGRWALRKIANVLPPSVVKNRVLRWSGVNVGANVFIGDGVRFIDGFIKNEIELRDFCVVSPGVTLVSLSYPNTSSLRNSKSLVQRKRVVIGSNSWIGASATLLPGTSVGDNSVIGANSLVKRIVPTGEIWVGNPARFLGRVDASEKE